MDKKIKLIVIFVVLLLIGLGTQIHINVKTGVNYEFLKILLKTCNITFLLGLIGSVYEYVKIKRLHIALSCEVGFIARAVFYTLSADKIKVENLKETFTISNAVIHSVGADISLLDMQTSQQILEFHSLMKVAINIIESKSQNTIELLSELFCSLAENLEKNKIALNIVNNSLHANAGLKKVKKEKISLFQ